MIGLISVPASAQTLGDGPHLIMASSFGAQDITQTRRALEQIRAYVQTSVFSTEGVRAQLARRISRPVPTLPADTLQTLRQCSRRAMMTVATGGNRNAIVRERQCRTAAGNEMTALNRVDEIAELYFDTCLYGVRARLELRDREGAKVDAYDCWRRVPEMEVRYEQHPPEVNELMSEVQRELAADGAQLRVGTASAETCSVLVNGRPLGQTPFETHSLPPGTYEVMLLCERGPSRLHHVQTSGETPPLIVDLDLDDALSDREDAHLHYSHLAVSDRLRLRHAYAILDGLGHRRRAFIVSFGSQQIRIDRVELRPGDGSSIIASAYLPWDATTGTINPAQTIVAGMRDLMNGISSRFDTGGNRTSAELWVSPHHVPTEAVQAVVEDGRSSLSPILGWAAAGLAVAGYVTMWTFYGLRAKRADQLEVAFDTDPDFMLRQDRYNDAQPRHLIFAGATAPFALAAAALLAPDAQGVPWWSWTAGAVGLGLVGAGIFTLIDEGCSGPDASGVLTCGRYEELGWALMSQSLPWLALPVTHLVRSALGEQSDLMLAADPSGGASAHVRMHF